MDGQDSADAGKEGGGFDRERRREGRPERFDLSECGGVDERGGSKVDGAIIAAVFAEATDLAGEPPDGGVIKEKGFGESLQEIEEVIVSLDVGEFMDDDGGELVL